MTMPQAFAANYRFYLSANIRFLADIGKKTPGFVPFSRNKMMNADG